MLHINNTILITYQQFVVLVGCFIVFLMFSGDSNLLHGSAWYLFMPLLYIQEGVMGKKGAIFCYATMVLLLILELSNHTM